MVQDMNGAPHYAVFSNLLSVYISSSQIFSAPFSQTVCITPLMTETMFHIHTEPQTEL
jgi:hypothetical protein